MEPGLSADLLPLLVVPCQVRAFWGALRWAFFRERRERRMAGFCASRVSAIRVLRHHQRDARGWRPRLPTPPRSLLAPFAYGYRRIQPSSPTRSGVPSASPLSWNHGPWFARGRVGSSRGVLTRARAGATATDPAPPPIMGDPPSDLADGDASTMLFTVEGMRCGGCSAAVAKVLNASPGVTRAAVNLVTETAAVEFSDPAVMDDALAAVAAKGFTMSPRPVGRAAEEAAIQANARREEEMERTKWDLYKAWGLTGLCLITHTTHHLHHFGLHEYAHGELLTALGQPWVGGAIAALALAGPGREIMREGFKALTNGAPNMNSLVGVGASAAFGLSIAGALAPP